MVAIPPDTGAFPRAALARVFDALERAGCAPRQSGDTIAARCPAHDDQSPSLAVRWVPADRPDRSGRTLIHCHAQCEYDAVVVALGLAPADCYDGPSEQGRSANGAPTRPRPAIPSPASRPGRPAAGNGTGRPRGGNGDQGDDDTGCRHTWGTAKDPERAARGAESVHDYPDPDGTLRGRVLRFRCRRGCGRKTFLTHRVNAAGEWENGQPAGGLPLYRAPEIAAAIAAGETVYVVEGERDADRLAALGLAATCNPYGADPGTGHPRAGAKWRPEHTASLDSAAAVVVVTDHDRPGYLHAAYVAGQLAGRVGTLRVVRAALDYAGADVSDHLDAGRSPADLVPVDPAAMLAGDPTLNAGGKESLTNGAVTVPMAKKTLPPATQPPTRARTRTLTPKTGDTGDSDSKSGVDQRKHCPRSAEKPGTQPGTTGNGTGDSRAADQRKGVSPVAGDNRDRGQPGPGTTGTGDNRDRELPVVPSDVGVGDGPAGRIPMSQGMWRYSTGEDRDGYERGVYRGYRLGDDGDVGWEWVATLPYVLERLTIRDGADRRAGLAYRLSTTRDGTGAALVDDDEVKDGTWARKLAVPLSADDKVVKATATAIRDAAYRYAPMRESAPRWTAGVLEIPPADVGPAGYTVTAGDEDSAREQWREIATIAGRNPRLALTLGVSLGGLFMDPFRRQAFIYLMAGGARQGKTTALRAGAALFGDPESGQVVRPLNATVTGITSLLGELGCLPVFSDELGAGGFSPAALESLVLRIAEGGQRLTGRRLGGSRTSARWRAPFLLSGNETILGQVTNEGVAARVVEVPTPIVETGAEDAERVELLTTTHGPAGCYGWPLRWLLDDMRVEEFRDRLAVAEREIGIPDGGVGRTLARHLALGIAGAGRLEDLIGRRPDYDLYGAALFAGREVLELLLVEIAERGITPSERLLSAVTQALVSRPASFPSRTEYDAITSGMTTAPREIEGFAVDGGVAVLTKALRRIAEDGGVRDATTALRQLRDQGRLLVSGESEGRLRHRLRVGDWRPDTYHFLMPTDDDDQGDNATTPPATPPPAPAGPDGLFPTPPPADNPTGAAAAAPAPVGREPVPPAEPPPPASPALPPSSSSPTPAPATTPAPAGPRSAPVPRQSAPAGPPLVAVGVDHDRDGMTAHLSDGTTAGPVSGVGDLAAVLDFLTPGVPTPGELVVCLTPAACRALKVTGTRPTSRRPEHRAFRPLADAGWVGEGRIGRPHLEIRTKHGAWSGPFYTHAWTSLEHPDRPGVVVRIVVTPWLTKDDFPRMPGKPGPDEDPAAVSPAEWAARLAAWSARTGVSWRGTAANTGVRMLRTAVESTARQWPRWIARDDRDRPDVPELVTGWERERPTTGYVHVLDGVKNYLSAYGQAIVAADDLSRTGVTLFDPQRAGYWSVILPAWPHPELPAPLVGVAHPSGHAVWTTTNVLRLYEELGEGFEVVDSWTAPAVRLAGLRKWAGAVRELLYGIESAVPDVAGPITPDTATERAVWLAGKSVYKTTHGKLADAHGSVIRRPDWHAAIRDCAWSTVLRKVYQEAGVMDPPRSATRPASGLRPVHVDVDAVTYATSDPEWTPGILRIGPQLGEFTHQVIPAGEWTPTRKGW